MSKVQEPNYFDVEAAIKAGASQKDVESFLIKNNKDINYLLL